MHVKSNKLGQLGITTLTGMAVYAVTMVRSDAYMERIR
jgi:hypothetical protein